MRLRIEKNMNKRQRNCKIEDREENWRLYIQQKGLVKQMIQDELAKHEKMITREIREAKDSGIKMWNMINKLRGIEKTEKEIPLYNEDGKCIDEDQLPKEMIKYWEGIYKKGENNMMSEWEGEKRGRYEEEWGHQMEMGGTWKYGHRV